MLPAERWKTGHFLTPYGSRWLEGQRSPLHLVGYKPTGRAHAMHSAAARLARGWQLSESTSVGPLQMSAQCYQFYVLLQ